MALGTSIAVGRQARLNINGKTLCFAKAVPASTREIVTNQDNTLCGDIDTSIARVTKGRIMAGWKITVDVTWPIAEVLFPLLGNSAGSSPWSLGATDSATIFPDVLDLVGEVHSITNAVVSSWRFSGSKGSRPVQLEIDIVGETEVSGSFAGFDNDDKVAFGAEYSFTHSSMTIEDDASNNQARAFDRFVLAVDNKLTKEWNNSATLTDVLIGNRTALFATSVPYVAAEKDLYFDHRDALDERICQLVLNNTGSGAASPKTLTFDMPACMAIAKPASALSKAEQLRTPVTMILMRSGTPSSRVSPLTITAS